MFEMMTSADADSVRGTSLVYLLGLYLGGFQAWTLKSLTMMFYLCIQQQNRQIGTLREACISPRVIRTLVTVFLFDKLLV
jgi:hypothetical protein